MPNLEISADQYTRNGMAGHRKASFIENLHPNLQVTTSRKNSHGSAPQPVKEEVLYRSKSLQLSEYTFSDSAGNKTSHEVIHKRLDDSMEDVSGQNTLTQNSTSAQCHGGVSNTEGILSIAILKRHILCDCLILTKKYRPSLKSFVLEFPAKIVEHSQPESDVESTHSSIGDAAMRDVEENTGYRSTQVNWVSPETAMDPELCDNKLKLVSLIIDGDDPIRNNFCTHCSSGENSDDECSGEHTHTCTSRCIDEVEVIPVPINGLLDRLNEYSRRGVIIDSRVYAFAIGLKKGEKMAQNALKTEEVEMVV